MRTGYFSSMIRIKIPGGLAYLSPDGKGKAILAKIDVFNMTSFFDDEKYYESNRPPASYLIPADGTAFIFRNNEMYVGNTFSFDSYLLTLAFPLSPFAKESNCFAS